MSKTITLPSNAKLDNNKLDVRLNDTYFPLKSDKSVKISFDYFGGGDMARYISFEGKPDFNAIFENQVTMIEGIRLVDEKGNAVNATAEMLVKLPFSAVICDNETDNLTVGGLIMQVGAMIISGSHLDEGEAKN